MKKPYISGVISVLQLGVFAGAIFQPNTAQAQDDAISSVYYTTNVAPLLKENCGKCHSGLNHRGGFSIESPQAILKGGNSGAALVPGHPEKSLLITLVHQEGLTEDQVPMPPKSKLSDADIQVLERWIKAGALTPK